MSHSDALTALAQAISGSGTVELLTESSEPTTSFVAASSVKLTPPNVVLPKSQTTRYFKANSTSEYYTLEALVLLYLFRDAPSAEYMKHAREAGIQATGVPITERSKVLEYLQGGAVAESDRVEPLRSTTPTSEPIPLATSPGTNTAIVTTATSSSPSKRRYIPSAADLETVKRIKSSEVELRDRNTALRGVKANVS